ncbi:MAG: hypothetical protein ACK44M_14050, partial [Chloroflexus sp.]
LSSLGPGSYQFVVRPTLPSGVSVVGDPPEVTVTIVPVPTPTPTPEPEPSPEVEPTPTPDTG